MTDFNVGDKVRLKVLSSCMWGMGGDGVIIGKRMGGLLTIRWNSGHAETVHQIWLKIADSKSGVTPCEKKKSPKRK